MADPDISRSAETESNDAEKYKNDKALPLVFKLYPIIVLLVSSK
jgi:hypothetical protein